MPPAATCTGTVVSGCGGGAIWESNLLRRCGELVLDLEREEGERPMLRRPGAGGGDGGHP